MAIGVPYLIQLTLAPMDRALPVTVAQHTPSQEWHRHVLREEDSAYIGRDVTEGVTDAAHHEVLKEGGVRGEPWLGGKLCEVTLLYEFHGHAQYYMFMVLAKVLMNRLGKFR